MEKPLKITRIDLLVHPFYSLGKRNTYSKKNANSLLKLWKEHIDEVAKDPARLLFVSPAYEGTLTKKLLNYANKKLGKRFATFTSNTRVFVDGKEKLFEGFDAFVEAKGFEVKSKKVKTRGFGEHTTSCVTNWLVSLNKEIGLKNPVPYRNEQSALLPRKSISISKKGYPTPWNLAMLLKKKGGAEEIGKRMQEYMKRKMKKANYYLGKNHFKPRIPLKKRKIA